MTYGTIMFKKRYTGSWTAATFIAAEPSLLSQLTLPEVERSEEINAELDHQGRADSVE